MSTAYQCRTCKTIGVDNFYKNAKYQCKSCWNKRTFKSSRDKLDLLIKERGGQCEICGYNQYYGALQWHHLDPSQKEFQIGANRGKNVDELRAEISKCQLLCANCHCEAHAMLF